MPSTSELYTWNLTIAGIFDEAFERAGVDPASIAFRHINSAMTSLNLLQLEIATREGDRVYAIDQETDTSTIITGTTSITLASGTIDVLDERVVIYDTTGIEIPMLRISREDYLFIPQKTQQGRPSQFYIDHSTLDAPKMYIWPAADGAYSLKYDRMRFMHDSDTMSENVDIRRIWLDTICAGLAARMAEKYNPPRYDHCRARYEEALQYAKNESRARGDIMIYGVGVGRAGRRRRA